jgi:aminomethyltransferase
MDGARIPRQGSAVLRDGRTLGQVTSGMFAPTLDGAYALALVASGSADVGSEVEVQIRDQAFPARVVARPFYRRPRA